MNIIETVAPNFARCFQTHTSQASAVRIVISFGGVMRLCGLDASPLAGQFRAISLPAFGMWVAASRVPMSPVELHCIAACLWEPRPEQRSVLLTHRAKPNVVRESRF